MADPIRLEVRHIDKDGDLIREETYVEDPTGFTVICHQQNIAVDVPEFVEVNAQDTIRCMAEMSQPQWEWISTGSVFKHLWEEAFDPADHVNPPKDIDVLNMSDMGLRHVAGMIVLGFETCMKGRSVFFRNPETYLHPKTERYIVNMLKAMLDLCGGTGTVTATAEPEKTISVKAYTKSNGTKVEAHERKIKEKPPVVNPNEDVEQTLHWLQVLQDEYGPDKDIASFGDKRMTVAELLDEVARDTEVGKWFVLSYVKLRDGGQ